MQIISAVTVDLTVVTSIIILLASFVHENWIVSNYVLFILPLIMSQFMVFNYLNFLISHAPRKYEAHIL